jgi:uncharacterized protein (DUF2252 family)
MPLKQLHSNQTRNSKRVARSHLIKIETVADRQKEGKALRDKCPRYSHGKIIFGHGKERDPVALIKASNEDRLKTLIPIRHGRMLQSPFAYFRGTAAVQAFDLDGTPSSGIIVQACGDCHLLNFGGFASPERNLVFDINDFDETLAAPFEWDIKRLAASFVLAARWRGFSSKQAREITVESIAAYRKSMNERATKTVLDAWYSQTTIDDLFALAGGDADLRSRLKKRVAEAKKQTQEHVFNKITAPSKGLPRIVDQPPLLFHSDSRSLKNERAIADFIKNYRNTLPDERRALFDRFKMVDFAIKVVGVGSVGTRCFVALFLAGQGDPLFLQVKEARSSVLEPYMGNVRVAHNGQRVVIGQRMMQAASDIFLGWSRGPEGRDFYVRQLRDMKTSLDMEIQTPQSLLYYAKLCGTVLARAHDKAGDAAKIAGYLGNSDHFEEAIGDYAVAYADQVEHDYETFVKAVRDGKLISDLSTSRLTTLLK